MNIDEFERSLAVAVGIPIKYLAPQPLAHKGIIMALPIGAALSLRIKLIQWIDELETEEKTGGFAGRTQAADKVAWYWLAARALISEMVEEHRDTVAKILTRRGYQAVKGEDGGKFILLPGGKWYSGKDAAAAVLAKCRAQGVEV